MLPILEKTTDYALIVPYVTRIFPLVERKLEVWSAKAGTIPEPELRKQALASISKKRFHCHGGSVYALYTSQSAELLHFIVTLQQSVTTWTICVIVLGSMKQVRHQAIIAAVDTESCRDWYEHIPIVMMAVIYSSWWTVVGQSWSVCPVIRTYGLHCVG